MGGFREGYEGAQDYDLALRAIEHLTPAQICHIPRVLYHWRTIDGSTAKDADEKPYAIIAAQQAIREHLTRCNIEAEVMEAPDLPGTIRVQYTLPSQLPLVSLIIPTRNNLELLHRCIESIANKTDYDPIELLIINNNSDDPATLTYLRQLEANNQARIIDYPQPFNYADMNNKAVEYAQGEIIGLINNDVEVINSEWLSEMVSHLLRPEVGIVGARLWYPNDTLQHAGVILGMGGVAGHAHKGLPRGNPGYFNRANLIQSFSAVTGACLIMQKSNFLAVGGLDAEHLSIAFNDIDLCLKIREQSLRIVWTPYAELYHHESASRGYEDTPEKMVRFEKECLYMKKRWGNLLLTDPAYNPNLTLETQDFALAWPPRVAILP
jgi:GT2 family glycosyltransferase